MTRKVLLRCVISREQPAGARLNDKECTHRLRVRPISAGSSRYRANEIRIIFRVNQGGITVIIVPCAFEGVRGFLFFYIRNTEGRCIMSNISYNEKEEAFELPYKIWGSEQTVRFYTEAEADIMNNLTIIAKKLAELDGSRKKIASLIADEGYYEGGDTDRLAKELNLENVYVDIEEDDAVVCITVDSYDGYMPSAVCIEFIDGVPEITGKA